MSLLACQRGRELATAPRASAFGKYVISDGQLPEYARVEYDQHT
jgi:hypothetical protein